MKVIFDYAEGDFEFFVCFNSRNIDDAYNASCIYCK